MRGTLLFLLAAVASVPPALAAGPPKPKMRMVTVAATPRPRPALKSDVKPQPEIPLDLSKAIPTKSLGKLPTSAQELKRLKTELAHDKPAVVDAKQKSEKLAAEAVSLRKKLIATAARIESLEREAVTLGNDIERLQKQNAALTQGFKRDRVSVTRLLAILERLQYDMPPALAARPDDALAAARGAMLVGASLPPIYAEATRLARRITALKTTRAALVKRRAEAAQTAQQLTTARAKLETLTTQKEAAAEQAGGEYDALRTKLAAIAAKAANFQALVSRVAALRRSEEVNDGITVVTASDSGSQGPLTRDSLLPPVVGTVAPASALPKESLKNPGVTFLTRADAQVIAPADGRILFAGPYHKSGQVLILEITTGYDLVLAGLGRVTVRPSDEVLAGEPVGTMPAESGSRTEQLYFELRHDGHGLNPRPWLRPVSRKAKRT